MIGIIAGTGDLPLDACISLRDRNKPFFVISLFPEENLSGLQQVCSPDTTIITSSYYKAGAILEWFQQQKATKALLIGKVDKRLLLKKVRPDWLTIKFFASLLYKSDTRIMQGIVDIMEQHGITVIKQDDILHTIKTPPGILTGSLSQELETNIALGIHTAQALSQHDIGQTVVVKDRMVLAVEAIEGTDQCIKRGIAIGSNNIVICKAAQKNQNKQFDLPTLGPKTIEQIKPGEVQAIAWLSDLTLISQREEFVKQARARNITLISLASPLPKQE